MGNKLCCLTRGNDEEKRNNSYVKHSKHANGCFISSSYSNLQHISEREPENSPKDPSTNPKVGPLFVFKSRIDLSNMSQRKKYSQNGFKSYPRNTISQPLIQRSSSLHENLNTVNNSENQPTSVINKTSTKSSSTHKIPIHNNLTNNNCLTTKSKNADSKQINSVLSNNMMHIKNLPLTSSYFISSLKRASSTSTIYIDDCTVSQPSLKMIVKSLALATYYHTNYPSIFLSDEIDGQGEFEHRLQSLNKDRKLHSLSSGSFNKSHKRTESSNTNILIFDEKLHPLNKECTTSNHDIKNPDFKTIYKFLRNLFSNAQLTAECGVISLVYLERLLSYAELELTPSTWKRALLASVILASKVWDDQAVWNVDYCQILKEVPVEDVNELEKEYLEHLQFNINVPSSVYARYYFELRGLAEKNDMLSKPKPLDMKRARRLEAISRFENDTLYKTTIKKLVKRRCLSTECLPQPGKYSRAILS